MKVAIISAGCDYNTPIETQLSNKFLDHLGKSLKKCDAEADIFFTWAHKHPIGPEVQPTFSVYVDQYGNKVHQSHIENKSFSNSMNTGLRWAKKLGGYDHYIVIGNDGFPQTDGWVDTLIDCQMRWGASIVAPEPDNPHISVYDRHKIKKWDETTIEYRMFPAICWLIPAETLDIVGFFDESFGIGCYEDDDYVRRVKLYEGIVVVDHRVKLQHLLSQTFGQFDTNKVMQENHQKFINKWGSE